jgi:hypothetical protein
MKVIISVLDEGYYKYTGERNSSIIDNETWICNKNRHLRYHKYKNRSEKGVVKKNFDMKIIQISQMSCFIFLFFYN